MTSSSKAAGKSRVLPKTWASTKEARRTYTISRNQWGARSGSYSNKRQAAQQEKEFQRQMLEKDLEVYSYKSPCGPAVAPGSSFIQTRCQYPGPDHGAVSAPSSWHPGDRLRPPSLAYSTTVEEAEDLLQCLGPGPFGLDLEWNFSYTSGRKHKAALVQICSSSLILILHISVMRLIPPTLRRILEDPSKVKTGVAIRNDALKLQADFGIHTRNVVELSNVAKLAQPQRWVGTHHLISLRDLTRIYLGKRLGKGEVRTSNWEKFPLDQLQIEYAASDAFASLEVLRTLCSYFGSASDKGSPTLQMQLDEMEQELERNANKQPDLTTALRLSSHDLYQERLDLTNAENRKQEIRTALREIQPRASTTKPPRAAATLDSDNDEAFSVTSVLLAHDRAMHKWLYGNQSLSQLAISSNIKMSTAAGYVIKALMEAKAAAYSNGKGGREKNGGRNERAILDDFSSEDRMRFDQELKEAGKSLSITRKRYRSLARSLGWTEVVGEKTSSSCSSGQESCSESESKTGKTLKAALAAPSPSTRSRRPLERYDEEIEIEVVEITH